MSYIDAIKIKSDVLVWERTENGREIKTYTAPYYFYIEDSNGSYKNIYQNSLTKLEFSNSQEFNLAREDYKSRGFKLYESDIPPELKILSSYYYGVPAPKLNVTFLDIEVDYDKYIGHSDLDNPYAPINAIALHNRWENKTYILAVPPPEYTGSLTPSYLIEQMNIIAPIQIDIGLEIIICENEKELLMQLLVIIDDSDILCGWNSEYYDIPYIGKRLEKLGKKFFNSLSFEHAPKPVFSEVTNMYQTQTILTISGRVSLDYLQLFRKYELNEKQSYKLESISEEYLPELKKLEYDGALCDLYHFKFIEFLRYNLRDTEILEGFERKLGYVELANEMTHLSTGLFKHVTGTIKLSELATINYCHHEFNNLVVPDMSVENSSDDDDDIVIVDDWGDVIEQEEEKGIQGALVLLPQIGMHEKIGSIDVTSLYPRSIMSLNISPETLEGQFLENEIASNEIAANSNVNITFRAENGEESTKPANEWRSWFLENKRAVSGFGTVFNQSEMGIIPKILDDWFKKRKQFQNLKNENYSTNKDLYEYYDRLQYVYKIKLNSYYGAMVNKFFRFADLRLGESTTGCGRKILLHQCAQVTKILDGEYLLPNRSVIDKKTNKEHFGYTNDKSVIYGDTDSTYFKSHGQTIEEAIQVSDLIGDMVNKSFPKFMRNTFLCQPGFDDKISTGREIVSDRGIFVDKKRYILHLVNLDGKTVDKLKVMGLDTKKTTIPKPVANKLNNFIERFLKGEEWDVIANEIADYREYLRNCNDIALLGLPKGVKKVEYYTNMYNTGQKCTIPGHVSASILYNRCLEQYEDHASDKVISGMKIRCYYITNSFNKFKSIALPVDLKQIPDWFFSDFQIDVDKHIERLVDKPLDNILKAIQMRTPTKQDVHNKSLVEF
jgi:DNA polymerase elongation subunit (family B)